MDCNGSLCVLRLQTIHRNKRFLLIIGQAFHLCAFYPFRDDLMFQYRSITTLQAHIYIYIYIYIYTRWLPAGPMCIIIDYYRRIQVQTYIMTSYDARAVRLVQEVSSILSYRLAPWKSHAISS